LTILFPDAFTDKDLALLENHPDVIEGSGTRAVSVDATMEAIEATDMLHEMASSGLLRVELGGFALFVTASSSTLGESSSDPSGYTGSNKASGSLLPIIVGVVVVAIVCFVLGIVVTKRWRSRRRVVSGLSLVVNPERTPHSAPFKSSWMRDNPLYQPSGISKTDGQQSEDSSKSPVTGGRIGEGGLSPTKYYHPSFEEDDCHDSEVSAGNESLCYSELQFDGRSESVAVRNGPSRATA
jgi:hypothetical protein